MYVIKSAFVAIFLPLVAFCENVGWKAELLTGYFTDFLQLIDSFINLIKMD